MHLNYIKRDTFKLQYCIEGTGAPVIVIGSAIYYPRTFSQHLRKYLRLIFMGHRGFTAPQAPLPAAALIRLI
jgi:proline iminopeptidase